MPGVDQQSVAETSFVTDFSMKNYTQYGGVRQPVIAAAQPGPSEKEKLLTMQLSQCKKMLESLTPLVTKQAADIRAYKAQVEELTLKNQELMNQS